MNPTEESGTKTCWDAGEAGCGRLIIGVKQQVEKMRAGEILYVIARDPAAHIDLDHWCHMTGHSLVFANHPDYALKKKG
ncbi:MAG: sulfurtransferase TusA family protein [Gammaproteobacteria bacterium]